MFEAKYRAILVECFIDKIKILRIKYAFLDRHKRKTMIYATHIHDKFMINDKIPHVSSALEYASPDWRRGRPLTPEGNSRGRILPILSIVALLGVAIAGIIMDTNSRSNETIDEQGEHSLTAKSHSPLATSERTFSTQPTPSKPHSPPSDSPAP